MRTLFLPVFFLLLAATLQAQLYISDAIQVSDGAQYGNIRARVEITADGVVVLTGKSSGELYLSIDEGQGFGTPVALHPSGGNVFVANYGGSDIAAAGSVVCLVYMTTPFTEAELFFRSSVDGGHTWDDPQPIPVPDSLIPFLPTVAVVDAYRLHVMYMAYDSNYHDPQYVVTSSNDGGLSFAAPVSVSATAPGEVCDCCPANVEASGDTLTTLFRNNDQNLRDIHTAVSVNGGASFSPAFDIDPAGWIINGCPSSGPDGLIGNGVLHATWMSAGSGDSRIYYSRTDMGTLQFESSILYNDGGQQNYPRMAGSGDTIGIVFQNVANGENNCLFTYSIDGGENFSTPVDITLDSFSLQNAPDIAFHNGTFHFAYRDLFTQSAWYRTASFHAPSAVATPSGQKVRLFPNPVSGLLRITGLEGPAVVRVFNATGDLVIEASPDRSSGQLSLQTLPSGLYVVHVRDARGVHFQRVVKQ